MIPIGDARRRFGFPWMTTLLLILSLVFFLYEHLAPGVSQGYLQPSYGFDQAVAAYNYGLGPVLRVLTCLFVQGTGWWEPIANLVFLWALGRKLEDACGSWGFLMLFLLNGAGGVISALLVAPLAQVQGPFYGLSGVVAGLFGAYFILYRGEPIRSWLPPIILVRVPAAVHLLYWAVVAFGIAFLQANWAALTNLQLSQIASPPGANWPMLGAFFLGLLAGQLLARREFLYYRLLQAKAAR